MAKYEIHISDVRSFKSCRRKWNWASPLRGNIEPNVPYAPFLTGRAIHHALEMFYSDGIPFDESLPKFIANERIEMERMGRLWPQEENMLAEQMALVRAMLDHYTVWTESDSRRGRWSDDQFQFIALETEFSVPLRTPTGRPSSKVYLAGRFDGLIMRHDDGSFWLWETKTTRSIDELRRSLANDEQCGAYIYAASQVFDVPVAGVLYNIIRKKAPTDPDVLRTGFLSVNKSIDTTAEMYVRAIRKQHPGITNDDVYEWYGGILQHLLSEGKAFFARVPVYRTPHEIQQLQQDLWAVALEMTRDSTPMYPSPSWLNCNFCRYRAPCLAMNAGADYEFILDAEYRSRTQAKSWRLAEELEED